MRLATRRAGFAAPLALCMLAAAGALAAGSFYTIVQARRAATRFSGAESALSAAEAGLRWALDTWDVPRRDSLAVGSIDSAVPIPRVGNAAASSRVRVIRVTDRLFWVESTGQVGAGTAVEAIRAFRLLVAVPRPVFPAGAAVIARGAVETGPGTVIAGDDAPPTGWSDCPPTGAGAAPAIVAPPGTVPDSATFERFGPFTAVSLAAGADLVIPAGSALAPSPDAAHDCQPAPVSRPTSSWGDPDHVSTSPACEEFFPVIHALGDLALTGGRGQGVLVVEGRLTVTGPFRFAGVVLARGGIETAGEDVEVSGVILSPAIAVAMLRAGGTIRRSTCAVARVSEAARRPLPERVGGWAELF